MSNALDEQRADVLEEAIEILDTLWEVGDPCILPDAIADKLGTKKGELVPDLKYDMYRNELFQIRPDSLVFKDTTASHHDDVSVPKIKHEPPLTSISKASHEDRSLQEEMLFKWLDDCQSGTSGKCFDLGEKELPVVDINGKDSGETKKHAARTYNGKVVKYLCESKGGVPYFYQTYKLDGVALALYYENGKLVKAGLRPRDGVNGEDVTEQVKYVSGIKQELNEPVTCSIRGELICKLDDFEKVQKELEAAGEPLRANPRNHAAGGIRQFKDATKVESMRLSFIAYAIEGLNNPPYSTEIERAKWCNKSLGINYVRVTPFNFYQLQVLEDNVPNLNYEVDGVVVGVNDLEEQEQLGRHGDSKTGNPKGKLAWKFAEERKAGKVAKIEWATGRSGAIKPVAILESPVRLAGTNVQRVTLHNIGFMEKNQIGVGTVIEILKAGKIIPKIVGVVSGQTETLYPICCPSCEEENKIIHNGAKNSKDEAYELVCQNPNCPSQNINGFCHYLATIGVLGLGESRVTDLVEGGAIQSFADFYRLDVPTALGCGLSDRQSLLAIASVHMIPNPEKTKDNDSLLNKIEKAKKSKKVIPLWKLFAGFGISTAGKSAGKNLTDHFGSFEKIRSATVAELASVGEIGEKTAQIVYDYLKTNASMIDDLLQYVEPELPKTGKLSGKKFVLTGGFPEGKRHWEEQIEDLGGKCGGSVSATTDFVVEGTDAGTKADKARKLGIPLITLDELKAKL